MKIDHFHRPVMKIISIYIFLLLYLWYTFKRLILDIKV